MTPNHDLSCWRFTVLQDHIKYYSRPPVHTRWSRGWAWACCFGMSHVETPQTGRWNAGSLSLLLTLISVNYTHVLSRTSPLLIVRPLPSWKWTRIQIYACTVPSNSTTSTLNIWLPPDNVNGVLHIRVTFEIDCHKYSIIQNNVVSVTTVTLRRSVFQHQGWGIFAFSPIYFQRRSNRLCFYFQLKIFASFLVPPMLSGILACIGIQMEQVCLSKVLNQLTLFAI